MPLDETATQLLIKKLELSNPVERYRAVKELKNSQDSLVEQVLLGMLKNPLEQPDILIELVGFFSEKLEANIIDSLIPHLEHKGKLVLEADEEKLIENYPLYEIIYSQLAKFPELMLPKITTWLESENIAQINDAIAILAITKNETFTDKLYDKFIAKIESYAAIGANYFRELGDQRAIVFIVFQLLQIYQTAIYKYESSFLYRELVEAGEENILPILVWFLQQEGYLPSLSPGLDSSGLYGIIKNFENENRKKSNTEIKIDPTEFIVMLKDNATQKRRLAALMLSAFGEAQHIPHLVEIAHSSDKILRSISVFALGCLGDAKVLLELVFAFEHSTPDIKNSAVLGFSKIRNQISYMALLQAIDTNYAKVCWNAIHGLAQYGEIAVDSLIRKFKNTQQLELQIAIIEALSKIRTQSALSFLESILEATKISNDFPNQVLRDTIADKLKSFI